MVKKYGTRAIENSIEAIVLRKNKAEAWYELLRMSNLIHGAMNVLYLRMSEEAQDELNNSDFEDLNENETADAREYYTELLNKDNK